MPVTRCVLKRKAMQAEGRRQRLLIGGAQRSRDIHPDDVIGRLPPGVQQFGAAVTRFRVRVRFEESNLEHAPSGICDSAPGASGFTTYRRADSLSASATVPGLARG